MPARFSNARGLGVLAALVFAVSVIGGCDTRAFAPQDASIIVLVTGRPTDGIARVTVFVQDTLPPYNTVSNSVAVGSSVRFEKLGAGFDIEVGVRDLTQHRCRVEQISPLSAGTSVVISTTSGVTDTVRFDVRCQSGAMALSAQGLPPNDSAFVTVGNGIDIQLLYVGAAAKTIAVVPDDSVQVIASGVLASDGFYYSSPFRTVAVPSGAPVPVQLAYTASAASQGFIDLTVSGVPLDSAIIFRVFARSTSAPLSRDSAFVRLGSTHRFANIPLNRPFEVGVDGLNTHACTVASASFPYTSTGGAAIANLTTSRSGPNFFQFVVQCRSGTADFLVSGLPAGDSASVFVQASIDTQTVRLGPTQTAIRLLPDPSTQLTPRDVVASDGRTYQSPAQTVNIQSRLTTQVMIPYTAVSACRFDQPYAWYPLNGNANDSAGRVNGTLPTGSAIPAAATNRFGAVGRAFAFDGVDDRIELADNFNLQLPVSISLWAYQPASARNPTTFRSLFASDDEPNRYAGFWLGLSPQGNLSFSYGSGGPVGAASRRTIDGDNPIPADEWVHIAATMRGATDMSLYVNGALVPATYNGTGGPMVHTQAPARIGSYSLIAANAPWLGSLDEVRVYNCSLTAADVAALYMVP